MFTSEESRLFLTEGGKQLSNDNGLKKAILLKSYQGISFSLIRQQLNQKQGDHALEQGSLKKVGHLSLLL